jgi:myosin heavy subunit
MATDQKTANVAMPPPPVPTDINDPPAFQGRRKPFDYLAIYHWEAYKANKVAQTKYDQMERLNARLKGQLKEQAGLKKEEDSKVNSKVKDLELKVKTLEGQLTQEQAKIADLTRDSNARLEAGKKRKAKFAKMEKEITDEKAKLEMQVKTLEAQLTQEQAKTADLTAELEDEKKRRAQLRLETDEVSQKLSSLEISYARLEEANRARVDVADEKEEGEVDEEDESELYTPPTPLTDDDTDIDVEAEAQVMCTIPKLIERIIDYAKTSTQWEHAQRKPHLKKAGKVDTFDVVYRYCHKIHHGWWYDGAFYVRVNTHDEAYIETMDKLRLRLNAYLRDHAEWKNVGPGGNIWQHRDYA